MHNLTDSRIRTIDATNKTQRHFDGGGLYLEVSPKGGKWWRFKYQLLSREKRISLGTYPETSLRQARELANSARRLLANGVDPSAERQATKESRKDALANSFEVIAREWLKTIHQAAVSDGQAQRTLSRLVRDVFPSLGRLPVVDIGAPTILQALRRVEARGAIETAHRELQTMSQVFRYAVATGRAERDPAADLRGALRPFQTRHMASITQPSGVGELLRALDGYESLIVRSALQLLALTFVRPGEMRSAAWQEFDLETGVWRIPAARMKRTKDGKSNGPDHLVPLSRQALEIIKELKQVTGYKPHLFPSTRGEGRVMSDMTLTAALRRLGFSGDQMTAHGFRAMARTMLVERLAFDESIVEAQLAHRVKDALGEGVR